jgi:hypothetical protein
MVSKRMLLIIATAAMRFVTFGQNAPRNLPKLAPIPADPFELVTSQIETVDTPAGREAAVQLLDRARKNYALRSASQGYDLKVNFTVNSGGQTEYDGAWQMEDVSDPIHGLRWTATAAAGYLTTQINSNQKFYSEGTASTVPLRLHEARAALFGSLPNSANVEHDVIRTSTASFNGVQVTCVLLSGAGNAAAAATPGRSWEETEECIDPQTGLLQTHSQVPGRYYAYDYSNGPRLGDHVMPKKVTLTEAGRVVSEITVESLAALPATDPSLFVPTAQMTAQGAAVALAGAQKISRFTRPGPFATGATAHPVVVFGLVTASGELAEAHSLQPLDPNSQIAVEAAKQMKFTVPSAPGARPAQHFVFVIEKFVTSP